MASSDLDTFEKSWITSFFHNFPHLDLRLNEVNATFDIDNTEYQQILGFWALLPAAVCFVIWLVFLVYFICRSCQQQQTPSRRRPHLCPRLLSYFLIITALAVASFGFYENSKFGDGVNEARHAVRNANKTIMDSEQTIKTLDVIAEDISTKSSDALERVVSEIKNTTVRNKAIALINHTRKAAKHVHDDLDQVQIGENAEGFKKVLHSSKTIEDTRWIITLILKLVYLTIFILIAVGFLVRSKKFLMGSTIFALISLLLFFLETGIYLAASVALGDICVDPDTYVMDLTKEMSTKSAIEAYIKCTDQSQPYQQVIVDAQTSVTQAITALNETAKLAKPYQIPGLDKIVTDMRIEMQYAVGNLSTLLNNVGMCTTLHNYYVSGLNGLCSVTITSSAFLALICCVLGVIDVIIIFLVSCLWKYYVRRRYELPGVRTKYVPVDDTDPFLPHPPPYESDYGAMGSSSPRPWSERGTLQQVNASNSNSNNDDDVMMLTHQHPLPMNESPPPAYHSGRYVRQYLDSGPSRGNRTVHSD